MKLTDEQRQALIEASKPPEGEFIPFDGDDGCEDCQGWDGYNRRCDCGNRRVCWEICEDCDEPFAYPVTW